MSNHRCSIMLSNDAKQRANIKYLTETKCSHFDQSWKIFKIQIFLQIFSSLCSSHTSHLFGNEMRRWVLLKKYQQARKICHWIFVIIEALDWHTHIATKKNNARWVLMEKQHIAIAVAHSEKSEYEAKKKWYRMWIKNIQQTFEGEFWENEKFYVWFFLFYSFFPNKCRAKLAIAKTCNLHRAMLQYFVAAWFCCDHDGVIKRDSRTALFCSQLMYVLLLSLQIVIVSRSL